MWRAELYSNVPRVGANRCRVTRQTTPSRRSRTKTITRNVAKVAACVLIPACCISYTVAHLYVVKRIQDVSKPTTSARDYPSSDAIFCVSSVNVRAVERVRLEKKNPPSPTNAAAPKHVLVRTAGTPASVECRFARFAADRSGSRTTAGIRRKSDAFRFSRWTSRGPTRKRCVTKYVRNDPKTVDPDERVGVGTRREEVKVRWRHDVGDSTLLFVATSKSYRKLL